jgi:hypothetical protein
MEAADHSVFGHEGGHLPGGFEPLLTSWDGEEEQEETRAQSTPEQKERLRAVLSDVPADQVHRMPVRAFRIFPYSNPVTERIEPLGEAWFFLSDCFDDAGRPHRETVSHLR